MKAPMDSDGLNVAVCRENETLVDSHGWKGDIERQDGNEKETAMDSNLLKTHTAAGWMEKERPTDSDGLGRHVITRKRDCVHCPTL